MSKSITAYEKPLFKIFSSEYIFSIPSYQRPYAWTDEQTAVLFNDLYDSFKSNPEDNYFLGSIVLIKDEDDPKAEVIDGQQRLTTLTILLSIITSRLNQDSDFKEYLQEPGRVSQGLKPCPRLTLRDKEQPFFNEYVQNTKIDKLLELDCAILDTEAKQHILQNAKVLNKKIADNLKTTDEIAKFGAFLVTQCYLVVVSTSNQASAFRVFSVMNSRGLPLLPIDIIKADIIGAMPAKDRDTYTEKWEDLEVEIGREGFNDLFVYIRMLNAKSKAQRGLLEEIREHVLKNTTSASDLIDNVLIPYADAYKTIVNRAFKSDDEATKNNVNNTLFWLSKIDNSDWIPSAILFYCLHKSEPKYIEWFTRKLERLAAYMHVCSYDINHRIDRYAAILKEIEEGFDSLDSPLKSIELTNNEKQEFVRVLDGNIYTMPAKRRNYIITRLNQFVSDNATFFESKVLTIEHVLPQTIAPNSEWKSLWPDEEKADEWRHRIANLVPLTRRHNSEAQNYDFDIKKEKYFQSKHGTSSFALTTQVLSIEKWTFEVVKDRQEMLLKVFKTHWEL